MSEKKLIITLLSNSSEPWISIYERGALATWVSRMPDNSLLLTYFGSSPTYFQEMREKITGRLRYSKFYFLQIAIDKIFRGLFNFSELDPIYENGVLAQREPELHSTIGVRTLRAFEYALANFEWDYLWRANVSNYVNTKVLMGYLDKLPLRNFAGGVLNEDRNTRFLSGAGYLLSRDVVSKVLAIRDNWDHSLPDDVALGLILNQLEVELKSLPRIDLRSIEHVDSISEVQLATTFSYRCNIGSPVREDVRIMLRLDERIQEIGSLCNG